LCIEGWSFYWQKCKIREMKVLGLGAKWLFVLCLPVMLLTASLALAVNSPCLYQYGFDKYDVGTTTGLAEEELEKVASGLIGYFNSGEEYISLIVIKDGETLTLFNQREVIHLQDIKGLIWLDYWLLLGTFVYALGYTLVSLLWRQRRYWRRLAWGVVGGSGLTLGVMLAMGLGTLFGFDQLFWQFHVISFANDFWKLDPSRDYLIMLFPQGFFYDATLFCVLGVAAAALVLGSAAGVYLRRSR